VADTAEDDCVPNVSRDPSLTSVQEDRDPGCCPDPGIPGTSVGGGTVSVVTQAETGPGPPELRRAAHMKEERLLLVRDVTQQSQQPTE
jgi:hypothetical protein